MNNAFLKLFKKNFPKSLHKTCYIMVTMKYWSISKGVHELSQLIISPFHRHIILMMADGWLHGQHHFMDLSQMTEVNPYISKSLLAKLTA